MKIKLELEPEAVGYILISLMLAGAVRAQRADLVREVMAELNDSGVPHLALCDLLDKIRATGIDQMNADIRARLQRLQPERHETSLAVIQQAAAVLRKAQGYE